MVKVNDVWWEDGIGEVLARLSEVGIVSCGGSCWLIGEEERKRRREKGANSSTVLAKIRGAGATTKLCRSGLWVGGHWCSVRRFVVVPPKAKEGVWTRVKRVIYEGKEKEVEIRGELWEVIAGLEEKVEKVVEQRLREKEWGRLVLEKIAVVQERIETLGDTLFRWADTDEEMKEEESEEEGRIIKVEVVKRIRVFGYGKEDQLLEVQGLKWWQFERLAWEIEEKRVVAVLEEERKKEKGEGEGQGGTKKKKKKKANKGKGVAE
ncbi:hypothetical protein L873DRAFT_1206341 [Choiromyces venosus 120613-1]|uniref:Uncharacterized protein n=1 Tax=Choiromyces venosus 120613-1 TaxID=1336337 RepID=A0A3N4JEH2_9PEZI|nr:hypothetical protein L873DRAFT_1206341 [Choiromyces venosus 120613-1]